MPQFLLVRPETAAIDSCIPMWTPLQHTVAWQLCQILARFFPTARYPRLQCSECRRHVSVVSVADGPCA